MKIEICRILEAIYAASALAEIGARRSTAPRPALLHSDHAPALTRVVVSAARACGSLCAHVGVTDVIHDAAADAISITFDTAPGAPAPVSESIFEAVFIEAVVDMALSVARATIGDAPAAPGRAADALTALRARVSPARMRAYI